MAISKAQQKAVAKYDAKAYDKTLLRLPKGRLDVVRAHAEANSESVNGFIGRAIAETMERDSRTAPEIAETPQGARAVSLYPLTRWKRPREPQRPQEAVSPIK